MGAPLPDPAPRSRWPLVSLVVVVVCVVIVAAGLFLRMAGDRPPPSSRVVLAAAHPVAGGYRVNVTSSALQVSITVLAANLEVNGSFGHPLAFPGTNPFTVMLDVNSTSYAVTWKDANGDGWFGGGDYFLIVSAYGLPSGVSLTFLLLWAPDGSVLAQASWVTP